MCKDADGCSANVVKGRPTGEELKQINEVKESVDARYVSATNAHWQFSRFEMFHNSSNVERLRINLEGRQTVYFKPGQGKLAAAKGHNKNAKLTVFFKAKRMHSGVENVGYRGFPKYFVWDKENYIYAPRAKF